jgi:hypothetical protein
VHDVDDSRCGFGVVIRDAERNLWTLCHFNAPPIVDAGEEVDPGDVLGVVGTSGDAPERAPHLHIQCINPQGVAVDLFGALDDQRRAERGSPPAIVRPQLASVASSSGMGAGVAIVAIVAGIAYARRRGRT